MQGRAPNPARSTWDGGVHACALFNSRDEEDKVLLPFLKEGLEAGDRAIYFLDERQREERMRRLSATGVDTHAARKTGQLDVRTWGDAYLGGGRFDQQAMLALVDETLSAGKQQGFASTRLWANMEWALEDFPGTGDLIEYESRANCILPKYHDCVICAYDVARFSGSIVMDVLRTHPQAIIGGVVQDNPFYMPPRQFLWELWGRDNGEKSAPIAGVDLHGHTILIVEKDLSRSVYELETSIERAGGAVLLAEDVATALQRLQRFDPSGAIIDYDTASHAYRPLIEKLGNIPILLCGTTRPSNGHLPFVRKPVGAEVLLTALAQLLAP